MSEPLYLLDTSVLLLLARGGALGRRIDEQFGLRAARQRPLVCIVSHGEVWVMARRNGWGDDRRTAMQSVLDNLVTVDISHPRVIESYVELELRSQVYRDGARNMGKNDLWIAAAAKAAGAMLLTTDRDFDHLVPEPVAGFVIDPKSSMGESR
ncbi:MAG: PIN domain-containing protein [Polyangiaceae bacterium]|nr:PIN domain-containing protein [Polyangiaceae bacterium]